MAVSSSNGDAQIAAQPAGTPGMVRGKEPFLAKLRKNLSALAPEARTPHPGRRPSAGLAGPREGWAERFAREWQRVGGEFYAVEQKGSLGGMVARLVAEAGGGPVLRTADPRWEGTGVDEALEQAGVTVLRWGGGGDTGRMEAARAQVGLTWSDAAAALTGTLVEIASPANGRLASLLPPVHIAVFSREDLYPDRTAVFRWLRERPVPFHGLALITGPSRTGDIQNDLTVGVHGPKRVVALMVP